MEIANVDFIFVCRLTDAHRLITTIIFEENWYQIWILKSCFEKHTWSNMIYYIQWKTIKFCQRNTYYIWNNENDRLMPQEIQQAVASLCGGVRNVEKDKSSSLHWASQDPVSHRPSLLLSLLIQEKQYNYCCITFVYLGWGAYSSSIWTSQLSSCLCAHSPDLSG